MRNFFIIIGLILVLTVLGNIFPFLTLISGGGNRPSRVEEEKPDIQWALDAPAAPSRLQEAQAFRPLIALTGDDQQTNALVMAIRQGNIEAIRGMLSEDPGLVRGRTQRLPPLFEAVLTDNPEILQKFLDAGADIHTAYRIDGKEIHTPLSYAAYHAKRNSLFLLLDAGADATRLVCAPAGWCGNALSLAVLTGDATLLRDMVSRGKLGDRVINMRGVYAQYASVISIIDVKRIRLLPALHTAARMGLDEVAETLIALGADIDKQDIYHRTAEYHASFAKAEPIQRLFAAERKRADEFVAAIQLGELEKVRAMLAAGVNPDTAAPRGPTPLLAAIDVRDRKMVEMLLAAGADPSRIMQDRTPLQAALAGRNMEIIPLLLAVGGDPNERIAEKMPLFGEAVLTDDRKIVQAFLDAGASLTTRYKTRDGVIHNILSYAVSRGKHVSAVLLARSGANPDWLTCTAEQICGNVLTLAVLSGNARLVEDLILEGRLSRRTINLAGATVRDLQLSNVGGSGGKEKRILLLPPLHAAMRGRHSEVIDILLMRGADINQKDFIGRTPAYYAENR